jgi:hypothetical protein
MRLAFRHLAFWLAHAAAALDMTACGPIPTLIMPDKLETNGDVYEVSGANGSFFPSLFTQHIRFGPYSAAVQTGNDSDWIHGPTIFNGQKETREFQQRAWFTLQGSAAGSWKGTCIRRDRTVIEHETSVYIGKRGIRTKEHAELTQAEHSLHCDLRSPAGDYSKVEFYMLGDEASGGSLHARQGGLLFSPRFEQRDQPFAGHETAGFVFMTEQDALLGALDMGGRKRVAMNRELEPAQRDLVAVVCVTILLQRFLLA